MTAGEPDPSPPSGPWGPHGPPGWPGPTAYGAGAPGGDPYGPGGHGPGAYGPDAYGPDAYGPVAFGPGPYGPPPTPPWGTHRYPGALLSAGGSALTVLSFLFLPYATFFVSMTAPETIRFLARYDNPTWQLVWLVPVVATLAGAVALSQWLIRSAQPSSRLPAFAAVRYLSIAVVVTYLINIVAVAEQGDDIGVSVVDYLGAGFWLGLCGGVAGWVGARMETANLRRWQDEVRRAGGWS